METLRDLREAKGLTLRDVQSRTGLDFSTIARWERGQREPGYRNAERLASLYEISVRRVYELVGAARKYHAEN